MIAAAALTFCARAAAGEAQAPIPRCFGAASRDPARPCRNPRLGDRVRPTPAKALLTPNAPCTLNRGTVLLHPCVFGVPQDTASDEVALLGDSHAEHWRGALTVVADSLNWSATTLSRSSCPFSAATPILPGDLVSQCLQWRADVVAWFLSHPHADTVFVSDHVLAQVRPTPGKSAFATQVSGYRAAWRKLPPTVRHIVVLRDTPLAGNLTGPCVERAIQQQKQAGIACALPRRSAVRRDAATVAARQSAPRASVIDMTSAFCNPKLCFPVIGGALVYKDAEHITPSYSTTLGPVVLHQVGRLLASWTAAMQRTAQPPPAYLSANAAPRRRR